MSDLFASLSMASRALAAQRLGLDVVGQNIANVNTAGYARRQVELASVPPTDRLSAGGGVDVVDIRSTRDQLLERRLRLERPAEGREAALAESLSVVETALGTAGESIDGKLSAFFDAWANLSEDPTSSTMRQAVVIQGQALASAFTGMAERFVAARQDADNRVRGVVDDINGLVSRIAALNDSIGRGGGMSSMTLSLRDEQAEAVRQLSELIDVDIVDREYGGVDVFFANGRALAVDQNAYRIELSTDSRGMATLWSAGIDVTAEVTGGQAGGLLEARDRVIPGYESRLDYLAYTLVQQVNAQHATGYTLDGAHGGNVFVPLATQTGAASAIAVDPTLTASPRAVAAAGGTSGADNRNARTMAAMRDARVLDGGTGTFLDGWAELSYRIGQDSATAQAEQRNRAEIVSQIDALRDSVSGVSLDEEAMLLMKFQRAYEANARYFATIDTAIETLMQMVG